MSVRDFAAHLGVAIRTVSKWESRGASITLQPENQEILDVALSRSSEDVQRRFGELLTAGPHDHGGHTPEAAPGGQTVVDSVPVQAGLSVISSPVKPASHDPHPAGGPSSSGSIDVELERRRALGVLTFGAAAAITGPGHRDADLLADTHPGATRRVGRAEVATVREMVELFSRMDQRHGGGHARSAVVQYFATDAAAYLNGSYRSDSVRSEMFSAASELAYLSGWMAFDSGEHVAAWQDFRIAVDLADEAGDAPLAGHVLRAMTHQAVDLGQPSRALQLADASVENDRYTRAEPRERALIGVVRARALAIGGRDADAVTALNQAETELYAAGIGADEPARVFFFGEASLAHETACTLRDLGDLAGAEQQFGRSVRTRRATTFTRTHAVTLGYLGSVRIRQGDVDGGCDAWSAALDAMDGVRSGRTRQVVLDMRTALAPYRRSKLPIAAELDARAADYLDTVSLTTA